MKHCGNCANYDREKGEFTEACGVCKVMHGGASAPSEYKAKPLTNADRIRAMTDEELADFLTEEKWECGNYRVCKECPRYIGDCCLPLDEWLKQPAEVDD